MGVRSSGDGWTRFSNSYGNCVEVRRAAETREVEIRESECPMDVITVADDVWHAFRMAIKAGVYRPLVIAGSVVVVSVGDEANQITTTLAKWESFVEGVQSGVFDDLPEPAVDESKRRLLPAVSTVNFAEPLTETAASSDSGRVQGAAC